MMKPIAMKVAPLAAILFLVSACASGSSAPELTEGDLTWGPRLDSSILSPIQGAEDDFGSDVIEALVRAARTTPRGSSQSSLAENGRTAYEMSARVAPDDDGKLVYVITDDARLFVLVPGPGVRQDLSLAVFTDLRPGIEPDLMSYPHGVFGLWAWKREPGEVDLGAFWDKSPSIPPVAFGPDSPMGIATYEGDAVGLHAADGATTKFLADVTLVADFDTSAVSGEVDTFRSIAGKSLGDLSVTLGETPFTPGVDAFSGETTATVPGSGKWGARWSDGSGRKMGGTFGFAANDGSVALLAAFEACSCASADGKDPNDTVALPQ